MLDILFIIELDINYKVFNHLPYSEGSLSYYIQEFLYIEKMKFIQKTLYFQHVLSQQFGISAIVYIMYLY
jgi:hypothetical protein